MQTADREITRFVTALAGVSALLVALSIPAIYSYASYGALKAELATTLALKRVLVERVVAQVPEMWSYQIPRLEEALERHVIAHAQSHIHLLDLKGELVVESGEQPEWPVITMATGVYEYGEQVATLAIRRSYLNLVLQTLMVSGGGLLFAGLVFFLLKALPLRVLKRTYRELSQEKERAEVILYSIGDGVISADAQERVERMNAAAEELTGWSIDEARNRTVSEVFHLVDEKTDESVSDPLQMAMAQREPVSVSGLISLRRRDGSIVPIEHNAAPVVVEDGMVAGGVLVFRDVTEAREMSRQLTWQARHDALTGLLNRVEFERRVSDALQNYRNTGRSFVVLYLDLDRFKQVNDSAGHHAGDELLRQVSDLIDAQLRGSDLLARLGGDEFGVLLFGCPLERARQIANEMLSAVLNYRLAWEEKLFTVGVSIGVVEMGPEFSDTDDLITAADSACYAAKEAGRNRVALFEANDETIQLRRQETNWTQQIILAMAENRLRVYFQESQAAVVSSQIAGRHIEVLLRMIDGNGRVVLPGSFMPAAERHDLMPRIDMWVIEATFARHHEIMARFGDDAIASINLSGAALSDPRLPEQIRSLARQYGVRPDNVCFEIAETDVLNRLRIASEFMVGLRADGYRFALDDFGGGIGAFSYLRNLPVDSVKIDGAYVRDAAASQISQVMVSAINDIGHVMGVRTIAKSVDSERILTKVRDMGVDFVQGYLLHEPEPLVPLLLKPPV